MKIKEIVARTRKVLDVQPAPVQSQARINQVVSQISASDQQKQPTDMEKMLATRQYQRMKQQADQNYANGLQQQLAAISTTRRVKR